MKHALTFVSMGLLGIPATADAVPSCHIPSGRTLATGRVAKLIRVPTPRGAALFACIRRSGRKVALDEGYSVPRVAGRFVAWEAPGRPERRRIVVHDLRTGRERLVDGHVAGRALALTARGTIVWVQQPEAGTHTPLYANDAVDGGRRLDADDVEPASLRKAGRRIFWTSATGNHTAVVR